MPQATKLGGRTLSGGGVQQNAHLHTSCTQSPTRVNLGTLHSGKPRPCPSTMSEPGATILFWMHHRRCGSRGPHLNHRPPVTASTPSSLTPCLGAVPRITGEILSCQCSSRCRRAPPSRSPPSWPTGRRHTWCALHSRKREAFKRPPSSLLPVPAQISSDYELSTEFETELRWDPSSQSVFPRSKTTRSSPLGRHRRRLNDGREARFATHMPRAASRPPPNVDTASANLASPS